MDRPQTNRNYSRRPRSKYFVRRRVCQFCVDKVTSIDYKDIPLLQRYMSEGSKIDSRRKSGVCSKHQRYLATAIKRGRHVGMLPIDRSHKFVIKQTYQRGPERGPAGRTNQETTPPITTSVVQKETKQEPENTVADETAKPVQETKQEPT